MSERRFKLEGKQSHYVCSEKKHSAVESVAIPVDTISIQRDSVSSLSTSTEPGDQKPKPLTEEEIDPRSRFGKALDKVLKFVTPRNNLEYFAASFVLLAGLFISFQWAAGSATVLAALKFIRGSKTAMALVTWIFAQGQTHVKKEAGKAATKASQSLWDKLFGKKQKKKDEATQDEPATA